MTNNENFLLLARNLHDIFLRDIIFDHVLMPDYDRFHFDEEVDSMVLADEIVVNQVLVVEI